MALDFFAGCLGGCAGVLVGHPFDTVKVRLQTQSHVCRLYHGTVHCAVTIVKQETIRGLYRGMTSPMTGLAAINAIVFGVYGNVLRATSSEKSPQNQFWAGSAAGFVQCFVTSPMELAKIRMQLQFNRQGTQNNAGDGFRYKNPLDCLLKTYRSNGVLGIYRGLWSTILRDTPAFGVYFSSYEFMHEKVSDSEGNAKTFPVLVVGGLAGVLSWIVCYPLDVAKTRLQTDGMEGSSRKYKGVWDCCKKSYQNEGMKVFLKGMNSTLIRAFPTNAATFAVVSWVMKIAHGIDVHKEEHTTRLDSKRVTSMGKQGEIVSG